MYSLKRKLTMILQWIKDTNWLWVKYRVLAAFHPGCWGYAGDNFDEAWDTELWNLLIDGQIKFVDKHIALIGEHQVWVANHPYASGSDRGINDDIFGVSNGPECSRATALFLGHELKAARLLTRLKYTNEEQEYFFVHRFLLKKR
jgi:hypothetical protein